MIRSHRMARAPAVARTASAPAACTLLLTAAAGCAGDAVVDLDAGVSYELAARRTAAITDLRYDVHFVIPATRAEAIDGQVVAAFELVEPGPLIFDFAQPDGSVHAVRLGGEPVPFETRNEHVIVAGGTGGVAAGPVTVAIDFTAGDGSLNRRDDFLYTLFVPDRARVALPLFDQPNLKARFRLRLDVPSTWRAVANGPQAAHEVRGGRARFDFAATDPISSYLFAFAAGEFQVETAERDGRQMAMFHRETDRDRLLRNAGAIFDLHAAALAWLEDYTGIPYPFRKFDFVLLPAFQYGGMEHPGAIFYREQALLLDESATQNAQLGRASLIAHETAHMWFGDLVTMTWFDDVWMKETLANFMAARIVAPAFPAVDHALRFLLAHYPAAYAVDRTAGANAIRQPLANLNEAGTLYGPIIYRKAPIVFTHLERLIGAATLRAGLREYLAAHAYGNASWADLIDVLDRRTPEDLAAWSAVWVEEGGRPRIDVELETDGAVITGLRLRQSDPAGAGRLWNQRLDLVLGYGSARREVVPAQIRAAVADVPTAAGRPLPNYILANGRGIGYGALVLDARTRDYLLATLPDIDDALIRAVAWISLWESLLEGVVDPEALVDLARRALPAEPDEQNVARILGYLASTYWRHLPPPRRTALAPDLEGLLWDRVAAAADRRSLAAAYFRAYRDLAASPDALARLERVWSGEEQVPGVPLSARDRTALAQALAVRGVPRSAEILAAQHDRIDNPDRRAAFAFVRPALAADRAERDAFFASLHEPAARAREPWVLTALGFLHHPLRARQSEPYIRPSLDLLEDIQRTGDIFFPERWLHATLDGHQTARAVDIVDEYLADRPDLAPRLRAKVLQAADGLRRAARIVDVYGGANQTRW